MIQHGNHLEMRFRDAKTQEELPISITHELGILQAEILTDDTLTLDLAITYLQTLRFAEKRPNLLNHFPVLQTIFEPPSDEDPLSRVIFRYPDKISPGDPDLQKAIGELESIIISLYETVTKTKIEFQNVDP